MERQEELYEGWKAGKPGYNSADRPGYSKHQDGTAVDLAFGSGDEREKFALISEAYGFSRPHHREPWHFTVGNITPSPIDEELV
jgi:D-alanyl-D-alanine dipeptidase